MENTYLFQCSINKWQLLVFAINRKDAYNFIKSTHPNFNMRLIATNPSNINPYICCATTEKRQMNIRMKNERMLANV